VTVDLVLVGFGNVARRFVTLLDESRDALRALGVEPRVVGIATKRHGRIFDWAGLDAAGAARKFAEGDALGLTSVPSTLEWIAQLGVRRAETRVLVETTTLDIRSGEPAISHVRAGFAAGAHVITANKGPAAFAYRALAHEAAAADLSFLFEGAVMDGIPIFSFVRETLPASTVRSFRGVVNTTTNHILTALERGEAFETALRAMQAAGVAEADPSLDLEGWDAAAKTAAMANVWLDAGITPRDVRRQGVGPAAAQRARAVLSQGKRLKLVASATRRDGRIDAAVDLVDLDAADPLAILDGDANALEVDTWPAGRIVITQRDSGLEKTAYALVSDLVTVVRRLGAR
jgi:homoserine dehydrogenase